MTDSGLAAELNQSLEIILAGTLCERGNSSQNTAPRASTRLAAPRRGHAFERQSAQKRYEPLRTLCQGGPTVTPSISRKPLSEKVEGL
jgi:hypothetical protein